MTFRVRAAALVFLGLAAACHFGSLPTDLDDLDLTPPTAPRWRSVEQHGTVEVLVWHPSTDDVGVSEYRIHRDGFLVATTADTTYTDSSVGPTGAHSYVLTAADAAGNESGPSAPAEVTLLDVTPPSVPEGIIADQDSRWVRLTWQPSTDDAGVAEYRIYRDGSPLGTTADTTYTDDTVAPAETHSYVVTAADAAGNESGESESAEVTVLDVTAPSAPQGLVAIQETTSVDLDWQPSTDDVGVAEYRIYRDGSLLDTTADTTYTDDTVGPTETYSYAVTAADAAENESGESQSADVTVLDVTAPSVPQGLVASQESTWVELDWQPSTDDVGVAEYRIYRDGSPLGTTSDTTYADDTVSATETHSYAVTAVDAAGNESGPTAPAAVTLVDVTAPSVPQGLVAIQETTSVELDWQPSADDVGVSEYRVYRDGSLLAVTSDTTHTDATVGTTGTHAYVVTAVDAAGNESGQSESAVVILTDVTAPSVPLGLVASQQSTSVKLDWRPSTDDVGVEVYRIYRDGSLVGTSSDTTHTDSTVGPTGTHTYVVTAVDAAGNESGQSASAQVTLIDVTAPSVPQGLVASQQSTSVKLDWRPSTDDVGVDVYRVYRDGSLLATSSDTTHTDSTVGPTGTHTYVVTAVDAAGNESGQSGGAQVTVVDVTAPSVPQALTATEVSGDARLTWQASSDDVGVTGYRIRRNGSVLTTVGGTTYTDGSVVQGQQYTYTVSARDAAGNESAQSASASFMLQPPSNQIVLTNITNGTTGGPSSYGGHAIAFADVTGDGLVDFYVTRHLNSVVVSDLFYRNLGGGNFAEEGASRGIDDVDFGSHGAVWADLDNDGDYDLYNGGTGDVTADASDTNDVYRRNSNGTFTNVTPAGSAAGATRAVMAIDLERDGDLDLLAVNGWQGQNDDQPSELFNEIYRNNGSLQFTYLSSGAFQQAPAGQGATGTDFDGDGDVDVFAANQGPVNVLENVAGSFVTRSASSLGISASHEAWTGITTADVNNDGYVDLLLASDNAGHLYINDRDGTFTYRSSFSGTDGYMGGFADLDNDGDLDLVFAGQGRVWVNDGNGSFSTYQTFSMGGVDDPRSIAFADIDNDGDVDFFVAQKRTTNRMIRNDYAGANKWLKVRLTGPQGQAGAFGATVKVYAANTTNLIGFREARGTYGYVAQDDPVLHFGLGSQSLVDVVVRFPNGSQTTFEDVSANGTLTVGP